MKVLLIKPISSRIYDMEEYYVDIGLEFLATALKKKGYSVRILDCMQERMNFIKFSEFIKANKFDVYGIKVYSHTLPSTKKMIRIIKDIYPDSTVIVGGPHPSGVVDEIFNHLPGIDYAFQGEAEIGLPKLLNGINDGGYMKAFSSAVVRYIGR